VWIVDPLDGTWEFSTRGRDDWAVHIALWQRTGAARPATSGPTGPDGGITDAAVALPAVGEVYRTDTVSPPAPRAEGPIRITASASRPPAVLWRLRDQMDIEFSGGSAAGAKAMACGERRPDAHLRVQAGSGGGIRRAPAGWCGPPGCTLRGWMARR
jgi:3'(2'), 5'-bisphosphate nucleotidase